MRTQSRTSKTYYYFEGSSWFWRMWL